MSPRWPSLLLLVSALAARPVRGEAQFHSFSNPNLEVSVDRTQRAQTEHLTINQRQCEGKDGTGVDSVEVRLQVTNLGLLSRQADVLEFWLGPRGVDCHGGLGRVPGPSGESPCVEIAPPSQTVLSKRQNLYFMAWDLFASPGRTPRLCDRQGEQTLFVVPLAYETPSDPLLFVESGIGLPISVRFEVDTVPPSPVSGLAVDGDEKEVKLSWLGTLPDELHTFEVYFDPSSIRLANPGPCSSPWFAPGSAIESDAVSVPPFTTQEPFISMRLTDLGLLPGEKVPATVVVRDQAGNLSTVSEVVCVERPLPGDADAEASTGRGDDGCSVHAPRVRGSARQPGRGGLASSALVALWFAARQLRLGPGRLRLRRVRKSSSASV
jgi:hypothetical protein